MDTNDDLALEGRRTKGAIYAVEHVTSGKRYVGSATNFSRRLWDTQAALEKRSHHNVNLNAVLVAEGPENFKLVVLELVDDLKLLPILKRLHIENARQSTGGCFNGMPPPSRPKLTFDWEAHKAVAEKRRQAAAAEKSLSDAIDRMDAQSRRRLVDQAISNLRKKTSRTRTPGIG